MAGNLGALKGMALTLGQGLTMVADSLGLPEDARAQLSSLHDSAEPVPFEQIRATVEELDDDRAAANLTLFADVYFRGPLLRLRRPHPERKEELSTHTQ